VRRLTRAAGIARRGGDDLLRDEAFGLVLYTCGLIDSDVETSSNGREHYYCIRVS
jgi:hypothetical protein